MQTDTIHKQTVLPAPLNVVWRYLGHQDGLTDWLKATVTFSPHDGSVYEERGSFEAMPYVMRGRVLRYLPPRELLLAYRDVTSAARQWPVFTAVRLCLEARDGSTGLDVLHTGFDTLPDRFRVNSRLDFDVMWSTAIQRLHDLLPSTS